MFIKQNSVKIEIQIGKNEYGGKRKKREGMRINKDATR